MDRREALRAGGALAILSLLGCNQAPRPVVPSASLSAERNLDQVKAYIEERKNALIPGFYKWLQEVQPNLSLTLDETMKAFVLVGSFKE